MRCHEQIVNDIRPNGQLFKHNRVCVVRVTRSHDGIALLLKKTKLKYIERPSQFQYTGVGSRNPQQTAWIFVICLKYCTFKDAMTKYKNS